MPRDAHGKPSDSRYLVFLDSELLNLCVDGAAQTLDTTSTVSREVLRLGYGKMTNVQLGLVGKRAAAAYHRKYARSCPVHRQYVEGAVRDIHTYNHADLDLVHEAIRFFAPRWGIQRT